MAMTRLEVRQVPASVKIVAAAVMGAVGGFVATATVLRSVEFGILGGIGAAVVSMIAALAQVEQADA
jgi:hypothetical protein